MDIREPKKFPRRAVLQGLAAAPFLVGSAAPAASPVLLSATSQRRVPMLQTWAEEARAWVVVQGPAGLSFEPRNDSCQIQVLKVQPLNDSFRHVLYRLQIDGLTPFAYSFFEVYQDSQLLDVRSLKGLDLNARSPQIAVMSCASYRELEFQEFIYSYVHEAQTDLILFTGDAVYSNSRTSTLFGVAEDPARALERYIETWNNVNLYQLDPLVPTLATWDDHDYGMNNGDASHPQKQKMQEIFRSYYAMPEEHPSLSYGPGISFRLRAFGIDFHMLDDRSFYRKRQIQWGEAQETWFMDEYLESPFPAWILNGIQFFNYFALAENVLTRAPNSLRRLVEVIKNRRKPTVLWSGDVHCSQVERIPKDIFGYQTYEITSSAVHSSCAKDWLRRNFESGQWFYYGYENFIIAQPEMTGSSMILHLRCATMNSLFQVPNSPLEISAGGINGF